MATSYCLLFLWMVSLVALSHSEHTIQVQVFPSKYYYSPADHLPPSDFIYYDEACQTVSNPLVICSGTPKLIDCDLGPDNGLPGDTTESFYSLKLIDKHFFSFEFNNSVNLTAFALHYYCTVDMQLQGNTFCVGIYRNVYSLDFLQFCLPCISSHKQREIIRLSYEILEPSKQLLKMFISSDYPSHLHVSEIQFFTEVPVIDGFSDDQKLRIPCLVFTSDVPSTCDHWWVDYGSFRRKNITLGVHDRLPECGSNNTSSVCVDEEYTDDGDGANSCQIVVTFEDDCSQLMPTVSLIYDSAALPAATESSTPTSPPSGTRDSNVAVIAGAVIGVVAGLTLCAIVSLLIIILLSCRRKESIAGLFLRKRKNDLVIPLNMHNMSAPIEEENTAADTQPFDGVSNPVYLPNACGHAESQTLGTTQTPSAGQGQPLLYEEVKNRDHSRIRDHTHLCVNGREGDSQLNSEPAYCLATPSVIQLDPTYSLLKLQDSRAAAKLEQDPTYSHLDHKTTATVQDPTYSHFDHKTTATVQDPTYSHLDHKTSTVKQDSTYSHIHHRLTAEEQSSALNDEYAHLDCKTATKKPDPVSTDYSHLKLNCETLSEQQNPTSS